MVKTMKRIEHLAKGKGVLESKFAFRESKITRTLDALIDSAEEEALEAESRAEQALEGISAVADSSDGIARAFNKYVEEMTVAQDYRNSRLILVDLKGKLQEDVQVEPDSVAVEVLQ